MSELFFAYIDIALGSLHRLLFLIYFILSSLACEGFPKVSSTKFQLAKATELYNGIPVFTNEPHKAEKHFFHINDKGGRSKV